MNVSWKQRARFTNVPQLTNRNRYIAAVAIAFVGGACSTIAVKEVSAATSAQSQGVCDIYAAGGNDTVCVAAHSTTRALFSNYSGPLYQVTRTSDNQPKDIGLLSQGGYVDATQQDSFCANATCYISKIYDQSLNHNDLTVATGSIKGPAKDGYDNLAVATAAPITIAGHKAYGVYVAPGTGYRNNNTKRVFTTGGTAQPTVATGDAAEGMYAVLDGTHYNDGACCFDYGNAENNGAAGLNGTMEAITFHNGQTWGWGDGPGPWLLADMENGMYSGVNQGHNAGDPSISGVRFLTAMLRGKTNFWSLQGGDAQGANASGKFPPGASLAKLYEGQRPNPSTGHPELYSPMRKEGGIILGTGGDNSTWSAGTFYEGAMTAKNPTSTSTDPTSGYPSDATNAAVQANIVQAGYTAINPWSAGGVAINAGGPATGNFVEDVGFIGGTGITNNQATGTGVDNYARPKIPNPIDTGGVGAPAPMEVYQTERKGQFAYNVVGLTPGGSYLVRLHESENDPRFSAVGGRQFNVSANGVPELGNYDIFASAGNTGFKAVVPAFSAVADKNGTIALSFTKGAAGDPKVGGIEVRQSIVRAAPGGAGGSAATSFANTGFSGGSIYNMPTSAATPNPINVSKMVAPAPQKVYETELYGKVIYTAHNLTPRQTYLVRLHESENWFKSAGARKFNVSANGKRKLTDYDIFAAAGGYNIAVAPEFYVAADQYGQIELDFDFGSANQPKINGVEILR